MTVKEVIAASIQIHEQADPAEVTGWLLRLDARLWDEVVQGREGDNEIKRPERYEPQSELMLPMPYDELYSAYVAYRLYRRLGDVERTEDAAALAREREANWRAYHLRTHGQRSVQFTYR